MSGYAWPLKTVRDVLRIEVGGRVTWEMDRLDPDIMSVALFRKLIALVEPWAIVIDQSDVEVRKGKQAADYTIPMVARWRPTGRPSRLVGDEYDGTEVHIPDQVVYGIQRWRMARKRSPAYLSEESHPSSALDIVTYELGGWSEGDRCWLFVAGRV